MNITDKDGNEVNGGKSRTYKVYDEEKKEYIKSLIAPLITLNKDRK